MWLRDLYSMSEGSTTSLILGTPFSELSVEISLLKSWNLKSL